jgi:hypothetical protein
MPTQTVAAFGYERCLRLFNEAAELIITTDIGPRVLSYRLSEGESVLRAFPEQMGKSGEPEYLARGGHRLWTAPENDLTYVPDNVPVTFERISSSSVRLIDPAKAPWLVRKELTVTLAEEGPGVTLRHRLINESPAEVSIATWGLTVMAPGGCQIIPQPPLGKHPDDLLPERVIVPWTYTDFSDDRWKLGPQFWRLTPRTGRPATKMGFLLNTGWVGYALPWAFFLKTVAHEPGAAYPDLGCNYETFSKADFIELETLGPLRTLPPGAATEHIERWHLFADTPPDSAIEDAALSAWLQPRLTPIDLR